MTDSDIRKAIQERILVLDGAMGTTLQDKDLSADDFGGPALEGCNENLNLTRPDVIREVHEEFLAAGADIVETNTFGSTALVLDEYDLGAKAFEITRRGAEIARAACDKFATPQRPRWVAGSMGPTTKSIFVTRGVTFDQLVDQFAGQAEALIAGGSDFLLLETTQDILNLKAGLIGCDKAFAKTGKTLPVAVSATIEVMGTTLGGQNIEAFYLSIENRDLLYIGLNCATGPDFMTDHLRTLAQIARVPVACVPNAGLPDEDGNYNETPQILAKKVERFIASGWTNVVGGCCGTTPAHIKLLAQGAAGKTPRAIDVPERASAAGLDPYLIDDAARPILVGERTNSIGSRKFKEMIADGEYEAAAEIGRKQVRGGAQIVDVCLANPDRDEKADVIAFLEHITRKVKVPIMIDSTDTAVLEEALKRCPGKIVYNSINLEEGETRFAEVAPLLKAYGGAVVVGTIDEDKIQGMGVTRARKLEIATRSHKLLTGKYGIPERDIIFDPLVFPVGTGDKNYYGSAEETIEGVRLIKERFPRCQTILGVSNVSFGLPPAGREVLNAVFIHHCVQAGLDMAIVNSEKLARFASLSKEEVELANKILFWKGPGDPKHPAGFDAIGEFSDFFRTKKTAEKTADERKHLSPEKRIALCVVEGTKEGLIDDLDVLLERGLAPLAIINGPLMEGMAEVGRLFARNDLIVAEVLQSAEAMKAAVAHLEPLMEKSGQQAKGKIILATVKGDVHDIGKNLVHIILKNNGFEVVDLGIKIPPEKLIEEVHKHRPDLVGLSGLLVKSAQMMVLTAGDFKAKGIDVPILVGGAALSSKFTAKRIAPEHAGHVFYAKDAMTGLDLANQWVDEDARPGLIAKNEKLQRGLRTEEKTHPKTVVPATASPKAEVRPVDELPTPPDLKIHVLADYDLDTLFKYVNPIMLYGRHLGLKGSPERLFAAGDAKALELKKIIEDLQAEVVERKLIKPKAVYRFFPVFSTGQKMLVFDQPGAATPLETFEFPRQEGGEGLCLTDYTRTSRNGVVDFVAMFAVTCGQGVREMAEELREKGDYLRSHALQALAIETAEGFAEHLHEKIRQMWGFPDPADMTVKQKFQAKYRGIRVSFGYPACPNLEDQEKLWRLLEPAKHIGIELTDGFMMDPEASVSALVFHHPQAKYFAV